MLAFDIGKKGGRCFTVGFRSVFERFFSDSHSFSLERSKFDELEIVFHNKKELPFHIDFQSKALKARQKLANTELVCKAVGNSRVGTSGNQISIVYDLTGGLGRDSLLLATAGHYVVMHERNEVIGRLLSDAMARLNQAKATIANRLFLRICDVVTAYEDGEVKGSNFDSNLPSMVMSKKPQVVYLDPMYAAGGTGRRSMVKKETQMLHRLVGDLEGNDTDNNFNLFQVACSIAIEKVVVKRPLCGSPLGGFIPHHVLRGTSQRFDIYFKNRRIERGECQVHR